MSGRALRGWSRSDLGDVQGAERGLVRGGARTLDHTRYLYIETSEVEWHEGQASTTELLALLPDWRVIARFPFDVLLENRRLRRSGSQWIATGFRRRP